MTEKILWRDPYQTSLQTSVSVVDGPEVQLKETIFYAQSGGQESDQGSIAGHTVLRAEKRDKDILYQLPLAHGLVVGDHVQVDIEWPRRYQLMRLHFAAEIILELVYARLGAVQKIGAHIAANKARIDFAWPESLAPLFADFERAAASIIARDENIISAFADVDAERRYWQIADFAPVPCGGTHLRRTGEIGGLYLKRKNIGKGKERIEIYLRDAD
jgi:alanyl-tRNA synthetase